MNQQNFTILRHNLGLDKGWYPERLFAIFETKLCNQKLELSDIFKNSVMLAKMVASGRLISL